MAARGPAHDARMSIVLPSLPSTVQVLVHDWLSANCVVMHDDQHTASVVDTGHLVRIDTTLAGVRAALGGRRLARIVNTHLHSDHCGGNAGLQRALAPGGACRVLVPAGELQAVNDWDESGLSFVQTGQSAEAFRASAGYAAGEQLWLGGLPWQVHAAPGHDDHALMLFQPDARILISGDALWEHGFGVLFPELVGGDGFDAQRATLRCIEQLAPNWVIPGHGPVFGEVGAALERADARLQMFAADPPRHAAHALRVLLKFHLLECGRALPRAQVQQWFEGTELVQRTVARHCPGQTVSQVFLRTLDDLLRVGAALQRGDALCDPDVAAGAGAPSGA